MKVRIVMKADKPFHPDIDISDTIVNCFQLISHGFQVRADCEIGLRIGDGISKIFGLIPR